MAKAKQMISIDEELLQRVKQEAVKKGVHLSNYISFILSEKLEQKEMMGTLGELLEMAKAQEAKEQEKQSE